ncbi:MAG: methylmalonyl Co-A mutase-associated GTPase MeaB [Anaerolineae bacterium]
MIELVDPLIAGDRRALARLLTAVENERGGIEVALSALYPHTGHAWIIGITGAPGTGKSTLVTELAKAYRAQNETVGILAIDPSSPFTGGALLGDRIRMRELSGDKGVFIRSMATRGSLGGLARAARDAIRLLDSAGFDRILVETVGAGQSEVDIARAAHTTLVIEAPGLGDDIQAIKAGILEIADILVVNKADHPGVENTVRALKAMLELGHPTSRTQTVSHHRQSATFLSSNGEHQDDSWIPQLIRTVATSGECVTDLVGAIEEHRTFLTQNGRKVMLERQHLHTEVIERLSEQLLKQVLAALPVDELNVTLDSLQSRTLDPQTAVKHLLAQHAMHMAK